MSNYPTREAGEIFEPSDPNQPMQVRTEHGLSDPQQQLVDARDLLNNEIIFTGSSQDEVRARMAADFPDRRYYCDARMAIKMTAGEYRHALQELGVTDDSEDPEGQDVAETE